MCYELSDSISPLMIFKTRLQVRGDSPDHCFAASGRTELLNGSLSALRAIYAALAKRGKAARVARFSPHDLRKTYASGLIDSSGGDISTVSRLLGHASINTTAIYDRRGEVAKRKVADSLHLPLPDFEQLFLYRLNYTRVLSTNECSVCDLSVATAHQWLGSDVLIDVCVVAAEVSGVDQRGTRLI